MAMLAARQLSGPSVRLQYPPPGNTAQEFFLAKLWLNGLNRKTALLERGLGLSVECVV